MKNTALMYDKTPLNTLQLSFLSIWQQRYYMGTVTTILQKKKILIIREIQVSCTSENNWPLGGFELSISSLRDFCQHRLKPTVCAVNAGSAPLNSAWVRRQRAHMLLGAWLSPQLRVCSEAESKTGRALESMPQVEWATDLWMLILVKGRQWRCAGCIQVSLLWHWKEMVCVIKLWKEVVCAIRLIDSNWETKNRFFFFYIEFIKLTRLVVTLPVTRVI